MNYLPFVGWGFYGAANSTERANRYSSWGLLSDSPDVTGLYHKIRGMIGRGFKYILGG